MRQSRKSVWMASALALCLLVLGLTGCGKDKSTNPTGGGGGELNSGDLSQNETHTHPFATAGTYNYHCQRHSGMSGAVVVSAGGPGLANVTIQGNSFQPSSVTVGVGGSVTWTNLDAALHTVTSN